MNVRILFAAAVLASGQSVPSAPVVSSPAASKLPNWAGAGAMFADPGWTGWAALAIPVSTATRAYSFSLYQVIPQAGKLTTSTTTGLSAIIRTIDLKRAGTLTIHGLGTLGVATTSTATTGAFAGGGGAIWAFKGFTFETFFIQNKSGASAKPEILTGFGRYW